MGEKLANNIAAICKAHGEDADKVRKLNTKTMYVGPETSNLQFVAMLLRIGDIVHFSYDRASLRLRSLHYFESDYSYEQWRVKGDSGINYSISEKGEISYSANCSLPKDYYFLMGYVDDIDKEIALYNRLRYEDKWEGRYPELSKKKVNRDNITHDESFDPVPNLKFTLEQNRIMELLMGAELYTNEYACLRELYQNSLDACRCQMAIDKTNRKVVADGRIEFGIGTEEDDRYVYCLDNGKGMSKYIIEKYLLKIGSSYYRSEDFYQSQAATGNTFTPTSQFGVGILSCFMIGDRIEITTREENGDYVSCVIEKFPECFYYKKESPIDDKELIPSTGTLVKVFLNKEYKERISNVHWDNIGYLLWAQEYARYGDMEFEELMGKHGKFEKDYRLNDNLYALLDSFVMMVPKHIQLFVKMEDDISVRVYNKPQQLGKGIWAIPKDVDYRWNPEDVDIIDLDTEYNGIQCSKKMVLPKKQSESIYERDFLYQPRFQSVDGIIVDSELYYHNRLDFSINFVGSERPQLSVSREKIVKYDRDKYKKTIEKAESKLLEQAFRKMSGYITSHHIKQGSELCNIVWKSFFEQLSETHVYLVAQCLRKGSIQDVVIPFSDCFTSREMTFGDLMKDNVCLDDYHFFNDSDFDDMPRIVYSLVQFRITHAEHVDREGTSVIIHGYKPGMNKKYCFTDVGEFKDYDIVPHLYPIVSDCMEKIDFDWHWYNLGTNLVSWLLGLQDPDFDEAIDTIMKDCICQIMKKRISDEQNIYACLSEALNENRVIIRGELYTYNEEFAVTTFVIIPRELVAKISDSEVRELVGASLDGEHCSEGLCIIQFGEEDFYSVPGRYTRQELVDMVPDEVWNNLTKEYHFGDGTLVKRTSK